MFREAGHKLGAPSPSEPSSPPGPPSRQPPRTTPKGPWLHLFDDVLGWLCWFRRLGAGGTSDPDRAVFGDVALLEHETFDAAARQSLLADFA